MIDNLVLHWPPRENPDYDIDWQSEAWMLEQRMEHFSCEAVRLELLALEHDNAGEYALADTCSVMSENMWREFRRVKDELADVEGGF